MKVSVDTAHDSEEDIRKVIAMLKHFVGDEQVMTNAQEEVTIEPSSTEESSAPAAESGAAFASMFADTPVASETEPEQESELEQDVAEDEPQEPEQETQDLFNDLFSDEKPKSSDEDGRNPKIQLY